MLPAILAGASLIGSIFGGMGKSRADARQQAANTNLDRDQLTTQQWATQNQNQLSNASILNQMAIAKAQQDLAQRQYKDSAPAERYRQAITGNLAQNMQDVSASHPRANVVHFSGGARPSAIGPGGRAAGKALADDAMMRLMAGDKFDQIETTRPNLTGAPGLTALPKPSLLDKILGIGSMVGAGAGILQGLGVGNGSTNISPTPMTNGVDPRFMMPNAGLLEAPNLNAKNLIFGQTPTATPTNRF